MFLEIIRLTTQTSHAADPVQGCPKTLYIFPDQISIDSMHQTLEHEELAAAKAFARLTRKARRMAKTQSKKHTVKYWKPAKPKTNTNTAPLQSPDSLRKQAASNQTRSQPDTQHLILDPAIISSNTLTCASGFADWSGTHQNVFSSMPALHSLPSAFAARTPTIPLSFWSLPPLLRPNTSLSEAFLLGATWATAAKPQASYVYASNPFRA